MTRLSINKYPAIVSSWICTLFWIFRPNRPIHPLCQAVHSSRTSENAARLHHTSGRDLVSSFYSRGLRSMSVTLPITYISHSLGFIIPEELLAEAGVSVGDQILVTTSHVIREGVSQVLDAVLMGKVINHGRSSASSRRRWCESCVSTWAPCSYGTRGFRRNCLSNPTASIATTATVMQVMVIASGTGMVPAGWLFGSSGSVCPVTSALSL